MQIRNAFEKKVWLIMHMGTNESGILKFGLA